VLDGCEHGGIISAEGRQVPEARAVYTRILTAANNWNRCSRSTGFSVHDPPEHAQRSIEAGLALCLIAVAGLVGVVWVLFALLAVALVAGA